MEDQERKILKAQLLTQLLAADQDEDGGAAVLNFLYAEDLEKRIDRAHLVVCMILQEVGL